MARAREIGCGSPIWEAWPERAPLGLIWFELIPLGTANSADADLMTPALLIATAIQLPHGPSEPFEATLAYGTSAPDQRHGITPPRNQPHGYTPSASAWRGTPPIGGTTTDSEFAPCQSAEPVRRTNRPSPSTKADDPRAQACGSPSSRRVPSATSRKVAPTRAAEPALPNDGIRDFPRTAPAPPPAGLWMRFGAPERVVLGLRIRMLAPFVVRVFCVIEHPNPRRSRLPAAPRPRPFVHS
jgi:hypothetical protein